jgi:hypothetical protein
MSELRDLIHKALGIEYSLYRPLESGKPSSRAMLEECMGKAGLKVGAEIGVWNGDHALKMFGNIPDLKLYCVDPWAPFNQEREYKQEEMDMVYNEATARLSHCNVDIMRMPSLQAAQLFEDQSLDFIHIDGCHYFNDVMLDMLLWIPKVRPGGIVSGHDFHTVNRCVGVIEAVLAYINANGIDEWYTTFEQFPTWFWIAE